MGELQLEKGKTQFDLSSKNGKVPKIKSYCLGLPQDGKDGREKWHFEKELLEYSGQILGPGEDFVDEPIPVTVIQSCWTLMWKEKGTSELHFWVGTSYCPCSPTVDGLSPAKCFMELISAPSEVYFSPKCSLFHPQMNFISVPNAVYFSPQCSLF